jgi:hypothetical protein
MARNEKTRERLLEVLDKDRKELADYQQALKNSAREELSTADRIAKNMALIRAIEARKNG